jgi:membrane protein YqaA with SNARE-associated domain
VPDAAVAPLPPTRNLLKRLYRWILSWAYHPAGTWALAVFSFLDSAIFPIPPLFLQVALSLEKPRRSFWYATVNTVASVLGACLGYAIGYFALYWLFKPLVGEITPELQAKLRDNAFWLTLLYSFVPLPYKLITIGSGILHLNLATLLVASTIGRAGRFYLLATVTFFWGAGARDFIDRWFNWVLVGIAALVVGVLLFLKFVVAR